MSRSEEIVNFLTKSGWKNATIKPLAGDASFRRYDRVTMDGKEAVLMDAPPEFEDTRPFVAIANYLVECGLYAPKIIESDLDNGFLLMEDLGDELFKPVLDEDPSREYELYLNAVNELVKLNKLAPPQKLSFGTGDYKIPFYDMDFLLMEVSIFSDWYYPALTGKRLDFKKRDKYLTLWRKVLSRVSMSKECLVLRDYHAENLLDLGGGGVGQLDFQDAVIGHSAYDLVSLLQDSRRDATPETEKKLLKYFIQQLDRDEKQFEEDYAVLGAQRAVKIIGIFARLCLRDDKKQYLDLVPRMWGLAERCLNHPALSDIKDWFDKEIPNFRNIPLDPKPLEPRNAMILAAGLGTRMRPLTDKTPKPLIKVAGKPMLAYTLDALVGAGIQKAVINKHHHAKQIDDFISERKDWRPTIITSDETDLLLDSGGGVKKALANFDGGPFYVLNSDMIWTDNDLPALTKLACVWNDEMDVLMLLIDKKKAYGHDGAGDFNMDEENRLHWRGDSVSADYFYGGIMIMTMECFENTPDGAFSLREIFNRAQNKGTLYGTVHSGEWYHVGTPESIVTTERYLKGV